MFSDLTSRVGSLLATAEICKDTEDAECTLCVRVFTLGPAVSSWIFQMNFPRGKKNSTKPCLFWYYFLLSLCLSVEPRKKGWWIKNQSWGRTRNTTAEFCKWWWEWDKMLFRHHMCCFGDKPSVTDDCMGRSIASLCLCGTFVQHCCCSDTLTTADPAVVTVGDRISGRKKSH